MDLIGPMGARETGHVRHAVPLYILVITDPFSHMLWLQPITTKAPEEVYKKFVENFLLEEGAPQFILTGEVPAAGRARRRSRVRR